MTLEEIRAMAACNPQYFDHCHSCMLNTGEGSGRGKCSAEDDRGPLGQPALAALLVRAVEETRATAAELDRLCSIICDEDIAIVEPVVESARALLRELGAEA